MSPININARIHKTVHENKIQKQIKIKRSNHGQVDFISEIKKTPRIDKDLQQNCSIQKAFLYSTGKLNEKEIRETISFIIDKKYLMVNLIKLGKYLYNENFKIEKKEIMEDTKRWKELSCSWIVTNHTVKNGHSAPKQFM